MEQNSAVVDFERVDGPFAFAKVRNASRTLRVLNLFGSDMSCGEETAQRLDLLALSLCSFNKSSKSVVIDMTPDHFAFIKAAGPHAAIFRNWRRLVFEVGQACPTTLRMLARGATLARSVLGSTRTRYALLLLARLTRGVWGRARPQADHSNMKLTAAGFTYGDEGCWPLPDVFPTVPPPAPTVPCDASEAPVPFSDADAGVAVESLSDCVIIEAPSDRAAEAPSECAVVASEPNECAAVEAPRECAC